MITLMIRTVGNQLDPLQRNVKQLNSLHHLIQVHKNFNYPQSTCSNLSLYLPFKNTICQFFTFLLFYFYSQTFKMDQKWKRIFWPNHTKSRCLKITEKVSFNIASEASYVYILSGQKLIKNTKNGPFWRVFENLKLAVKQCYQTGQF